MATTEKASSQSPFIDLCRMLGVPTRHDADPTGEQYAFERRVTKAGRREGFADYDGSTNAPPTTTRMTNACPLHSPLGSQVIDPVTPG